VVEQGTEVPPPAAELSPGLGLALSGGGFRAAFFHLGVLARLAELDILRRVEVISTVSGGSIIGALYYLHLKRLLEAEPDDRITTADYCEVVARMESEFLPAVQRNLRVRTFANLVQNVRMALSPGYSRSNRIGELYEQLFFAPAMERGRGDPIRMRDLRIVPNGEIEDFYPRRDNAARTNKVPVLLVNAATLNTGRNWRFEATGMGEPVRAGDVALDIDKAMRLRRAPRYDDLPEQHRDLRLGIAVAASTGIPGLFPPVPLSDLYKEAIRLQLADGGVHDNQGVQGLLDLGCDRFIVSDAGGQLEDRLDPATNALGVLLRTNQIQFGRIREEQLFRLDDMAHTNALLIHIRKGLPVKIVDWIGPKDRPVSQRGLDSVAMRGFSTGSPREAVAQVVEEAQRNVAGFAGYDVLDNRTRVSPDGRREYWVRLRVHFDPQPFSSAAFGIHPDVQRALSKLRTDLDSFNETEAVSLMFSGYRIAGWEAGRQGWGGGGGRPGDAQRTWSFGRIQRWMGAPTRSYLWRLEAGRHRFGKPFWLAWPLGLGVAVAAVIALLVLVLTLWDASTAFRVRWGVVLLIAGLVLGGGVAARAILRGWWSQLPLRTAIGVAVGMVLALLLVPVWLIAQFHLRLLDPLFLWLGQVRRLR
jgi:predicted acylesterase/phospholipase RssA